MDDRELFETLKSRLFTAVVGDVMDTIGLHRQFLPPHIRGLGPDTIMVGRAMPVSAADWTVASTQEETSSEAFGLMFRALDDLKPGEVYVCSGASPSYALWGGLMSIRAGKLGAAGAVVDGYHRDTREILALGFPVFSHGAYAQDQRTRGRVVDFRTAIRFSNGCRVDPGDIVFGDVDGVVAIPGGVAEDVIRLALAKVSGEDDVRRMIAAGQSTETIFAKTGIM